MQPGSRLGPYEIVAPIGAGGMGEVYRARDTRLDREVAVKVLPQQLVGSAAVQQRFEREARAVSSLNHPNICALFDVGREGDTAYLVMELVEGKTLAERLLDGPLPAGEVVRMGIEIADALEAAHRRGIVHRDLKPGNVMLTGKGIKLLDFGLAKIRPATVESELSRLTAMPTEASPSSPLTEEGTILGTYHYMAPEQLEGREADARSDIFAVGCILYEAASGRRPFTGTSRASLIGAILKDQPPPMSALEPMTPPALDRLVQSCLAKDPDDRLQTAHDVKLQLEWIAEGGSRVGAPAVVAGRRRIRERLAWSLAGLFLLAAGALAVVHLRSAPRERYPVRFQLVPPEGLKAVGSPRISPDGRTLAFSAADADGTSRIWVRPLGALKAWPLAGTEGAKFRPFWSPDSRSVAFVAGGKLKKVAAAGGPTQTICDAPTGADGTWGTTGVILFDGVPSDPIRRVSAAGGIPRPAVTAEKGVTVSWPTFLPDGHRFLYFRQRGAKGEGHVMVASLDSGEEPATLAPSDTMPAYASTGFLLFVRDDTLLAQPFDLSALKLRGDAIPIADRVALDWTTGLADFSLSDNGTLVYRTATVTGSRLVWFDRSGNELGEVGAPADYWDPALSPDGSRLAVSIVDPASGNMDIWIRDLTRGVTSRLTFDPALDYDPVWSPDGLTIVFGSNRGGEYGLYEKLASGTGPVERLWSSAETVAPSDWSSDGRFIAASVWVDSGHWGVRVYPADGSGKPLVAAASPFHEAQPVFSPDGRYLAYISNETGRTEVYVQPFPERGGRWQISTEGGTNPHWGLDGRTIYYQDFASRLAAVPVDTGFGFSAGAPRPLFEADTATGVRRNVFLVSRDGSRFLVISPAATQDMAPMTVVLDWDADLTD